MKLDVISTEIERFGDTGKETEFTITSNAQAFDILSSGIYTDPKMAVIRELSCNAYDAHVDNGTPDLPFTIHLPSHLSPYFSVKDDGIGLSDEDVRGLYSTYFRSTKTNTNDQIGAFGLGSKSPFSYSKSFDVIARFNGKKRTYTIFINEKGIPTIQQLACIDTIEHNGLEIKLTVHSYDYDEFRDKAAYILQYFPVQPNIIGVQDFTFPTHPSTATITKSYITNKSVFGKLIAVQGNVPYKVDATQLDLSRECVRFTRNNSITLFFNIGDLCVATNREEIRYTDDNIKKIRNVITQTFTDYLTKLDATITTMASNNNIWDVYALLRDQFDSVSSLRKTIGDQFRFTSTTATNWLSNDKVAVDPIWKYHKINQYGKGEIRAIPKHIDTIGHGPSRMLTIRPSIHTQVVIQDCTVRGSMRMNTKLTNHHNTTPDLKLSIIAIVPISNNVLKKYNIPINDKHKQDELINILTQLGNPTTVKVSEWTEDVVSNSTTRGTSTQRFRHFDRGVSNMVEVAEPAGGIYTEINLSRECVTSTPNTYKRDNWWNTLAVVLSVINQHNHTSHTIHDIYGLTKRVCKYVSTKPSWLTLQELYTTAILAEKSNIETATRLKETMVYGINYHIHIRAFVTMVKNLPVNSPFKVAVDPVIAKHHTFYADSTYRYSRDNIDKINSFNAAFSIPITFNKTPIITRNDLQQYPMLQFMSTERTPADYQLMKEYILMVDNK